VADQDEKEQIEEMRAWWDEYGNYVIAGVVIGVLLLFGWNYYRTSKANAEIEASQMYDQLASHVAAANMAEAETAMGALKASYPDTAYAAQGKLAMARLYMDNNRDADAADVLRELVNANDSPLFASVARLRLAKILQYQEEYEEVLTLLEVEEKPGFTARYAEARGDALVELERFDEARDQYLLALTDSGQTVDTNFLQLKILDLPKPAATDVLPEATDGEIASDLPDTEAAASEALDADAPNEGATDAEASGSGAGADVEADAVDGDDTAADDTATDETNE
jgi:predicted negative regulator of RcsB-dependent stress response